MESESIQLLLGLSIFAIMFSIGIGLTREDFERVIAEPRALLITLTCQLLLLPVFAIMIAKLLGLSGVAALGLLLLAVSPGGVSSNMFTRLAGGHTALSVSLTAINSTLAVVSIPAILYVGQSLLSSNAQVVTIPFEFMIQQLMLITFVPVILGMLIQHFAPGAASSVGRVLFPLTSVLFFLLIFSFWYSEFETYRQAFIDAGIPALLLFAATCVSAVVIARFSKIVRKDRIAMVFEVGIQNPPVAFFIAINILNDPALVPPSAVYAVAMVLVSFILLPIIRRSSSLP